MANNRKKKTLLSVLAYGSPEESQDLLFKKTGQKAIGCKDLEYKLAEFYAKSPDKVTLEKEFAEIHPHKDFILKYLAPEPEKIEIKADSENEVREVKLGADGYSNCDGDPNCNCNKKTQDMSGFAGVYHMEGMGRRSNDNMILGIIGVVAILGLVVVYKK